MWVRETEKEEGWRQTERKRELFTVSQIFAVVRTRRSEFLRHPVKRRWQERAKEEKSRHPFKFPRDHV